jgi:GNAT superfamily N-acetyltransferase
MPFELSDLVVRVARPADIPAIATLRFGPKHGDIERHMADWLAAEGDRRTMWLAALGDTAAGYASMLEYRRLPRPERLDSRWGYVGNMFVREDLRNRGIGSAILATIIATADERGYTRLVLSPTEQAVPFYRRAGFVVPDQGAGRDRLLVRPG